MSRASLLSPGIRIGPHKGTSSGVSLFGEAPTGLISTLATLTLASGVLQMDKSRLSAARLVEDYCCQNTQKMPKIHTAAVVVALLLRAALAEKHHAVHRRYSHVGTMDVGGITVPKLFRRDECTDIWGEDAGAHLSHCPPDSTLCCK
jgi:hypothetical protein